MFWLQISEFTAAFVILWLLVFLGGFILLRSDNIVSIEEAYNLWASQYDTNENKTRDLDKSTTIANLSKYDFEQVLELGCGTGKNTEWLLQRSSQVVGLDFSEKMLQRARTRISDKRVRFVRTDLKKPWPIEDGFADLLTSSLTLEHIADLDFIFAQARLKLRAKGLFYISELHPFKQYLGSKARFETEQGLQELEVYTHHISDYLKAAEQNGFSLLELKEAFDEHPDSDVPRLICFVFRREA